MNLMLNDPDSKGPSTTRSVFWYGCLICLGKLALSNVSILNFHIPAFGGSDFALAIGALGGIYALDKHVVSSNNKKEE